VYRRRFIVEGGVGRAGAGEGNMAARTAGDTAAATVDRVMSPSRSGGVCGDVFMMMIDDINGDTHGCDDGGRLINRIDSLLSRFLKCRERQKRI
jgi:hypothetical protein